MSKYGISKTFNKLNHANFVFAKGHALAEKADARTDFCYVPGHLGEF